VTGGKRNPEQTMHGSLELLMNRMQWAKRPTLAEFARKARPRRYWSGVSVGWFVLALAIFYWGLHYRLQQYESARMRSAVPMARMWLGAERGHAATTSGMQNRDARKFSHAAIVLPFAAVVPIFLLFVLACADLLIAETNKRAPVRILPASLFCRPPPAALCQ
jgi:hypothetical protein